MLSMTFVLASVPLAVASGASANSRIAIGTAVIGGMLFATFFAILFVPMFYDLIETGSEKIDKWRGKKTPDDDDDFDNDNDDRQLSHQGDNSDNRNDEDA